MSVRVITRQSSNIFWGHSVYTDAKVAGKISEDKRVILNENSTVAKRKKNAGCKENLEEISYSELF